MLLASCPYLHNPHDSYSLFPRPVTSFGMADTLQSMILFSIRYTVLETEIYSYTLFIILYFYHPPF